MQTEPPKHTRFGNDAASRKEERARVLTMKYGKSQMVVIRKRMKMENWIDEEVDKLFNGEDHEVQIELDVLLELKTPAEKKKFAFDQLQRNFCPASMDKITVFLDELIDQLKNY